MASAENDQDIQTVSNIHEDGILTLLKAPVFGLSCHDLRIIIYTKLGEDRPFITVNIKVYEGIADATSRSLHNSRGL